MSRGGASASPFFHYKINKMIVSEMFDWYLTKVREGLTGEEIEELFEDMIAEEETISPFED